MLLILAVIAIVLILVALGLLIWLIVSNSASRVESAGRFSNLNLLQQQLQTLTSAQDKARETLNKSLQLGQSSLNQNLQSSQKILDQLNSRIGELQGTNKQMLLLGSDVRRLQDILSSPKLRGQFGETSLENLLSQILPKDAYQRQYNFKNGKIVDALILLNNFSIAVDAKFPLPGFEKITHAQSDNERNSLRKAFFRDVIKHIDKISADYIRPAENTIDFALMYIPAENVYYETIIKYPGQQQDLCQYALDKKVVPVSPNLLYTYLMTVAMGLHGLQIEQQTAEIRQNLKKLNSSFSSFVNDWDILGTHVRNTYNKYEEGGKKLDLFGLHLEQIQASEENSDDQQENIN